MVLRLQHSCAVPCAFRHTEFSCQIAPSAPSRAPSRYGRPGNHTDALEKWWPICQTILVTLTIYRRQSSSIILLWEPFQSRFQRWTDNHDPPETLGFVKAHGLYNSFRHLTDPYCCSVLGGHVSGGKTLRCLIQSLCQRWCTLSLVWTSVRTVFWLQILKASFRWQLFHIISTSYIFWYFWV